MSEKELSNVQVAFKLPFKEQIAFYQQKVRLPSESYKDITAVQHDKAFVVAGAMKADLLKDLQDAVGKAITDGESLGQFRARFDEIVKKRGWTDFTGSDSKSGIAWRTKVIYSTNMRTSHAAGRWQQMRTPEMLAARPYWQYRHVTIGNPRLKHRRLNNTVLPADDGWWSVNYPPNGYGCNCYVRALSAYDVQRMNLKIDETPSFDVASEGFAHAPGSTWQPNLDKYSYKIAKTMVAEGMANGVFERWLGRIDGQFNDLKKSPAYTDADDALRKHMLRQQENREYFLVAVLNDQQQALLGSLTKEIRFSEFDALKQAISRDDNRGFDVSSYNKVQRVIDNASLIVRQTHKPTGEPSKRTLWVEGFEGKKSRYMAVLHQTMDNKEIYLKSYRLDSTKDENLRKRGEVLLDRMNDSALSQDAP